MNAIQVEFLLAGISSGGTPLALGKVYTYAAGGTTNKTCWVDKDKVTPASNPVTLDANGAALLYADGAYKFVIKNADLNTIYTWDNLILRDSGTISVADYGAVGDGTTDDSAAIQAAIVSLGGRGGTVYIPRGTYIVAADVLTILCDHTTIQGDGAANEYGPTLGAPTILTFTAGSVGINATYLDSSTAGSYAVFKNLSINGNGVLAHGIKAKGKIETDHVTVNQCTAEGIWLSGFIYDTHLSKTSVINNRGGTGIGLLVDDDGTHGNTTLRLSNFVARSNTIGVKIKNATHLAWDYGVVESNTNEGLILWKPTGGSLDYIDIHRVWFENNYPGTSNYQVVVDAEVPDYSNGAVFDLTFNRCNFNSFGTAKNLHVKAARGLLLDHCVSSAGAAVDAILFDTYSYACEQSSLIHNHINPPAINVGLQNNFYSPILSSLDSASQGAMGFSGITADFLVPVSSLITPGSGTGLTVIKRGEVLRSMYKVTIDYTAFSAAGFTGDKVIATLPAKTSLVKIISHTTTKYLGGTVDTAALKVGIATAGEELIASHNVFTAAVVKGLADADMGTSMVRSAAVQGGVIGSWTATTPISVRLTTTTGNTNALTQGVTTFYIVTEKFL